MSYSISLPALVLSLTGLAAAADTLPGYSYGNFFYLGPTTGGQYITKATYSMVPPSPPTDYGRTDAEKTWISLWIGLQENPYSEDVMNMNFVQPLLNWGPDNSVYGCSADVEHWCVAASTYVGGDVPTQEQQPYIEVPTDATLDFEVIMNTSTNKIDQKVWSNGELVSEQSDASGMQPAVFYSGNECYTDGCGTLDAYAWTNITIILNEADANFDQTLSLYNATTSGLETSDGGKTWTVDRITIEKDVLTIS
ncbi:unnamed protein product [Discula destructiva]